VSTPEPDAGWQPPPLPRRLTDPVPAVLVGSGLWLAGLVVLGVLTLSGSRPVDAWLWACVVGVGLGAVGLGVLGLQRRASARGSRGAQNL
jgi:hypothetical protein